VNRVVRLPPAGRLHIRLDCITAVCAPALTEVNIPTRPEPAALPEWPGTLQRRAGQYNKPSRYARSGGSGTVQGEFRGAAGKKKRNPWGLRLRFRQRRRFWRSASTGADANTVSHNPRHNASVCCCYAMQLDIRKGFFT